MVTTIESGFATLSSWLIPTPAQKNALSGHRESVSAKLKTSLAVTNFFGTGSSSNGTDVRNYSDVDYFASIPLQNQRDNSARMLVVVRDVLKERFPATNIYVRTPAVVCDFGTDASEKMEITPAYYTNQTAQSASIYKIPDGSGGWLKSSPRVHNAYVSYVNNDLDKRLKNLIRLMKAIKYYNNIPISSFYLELRTAKWASSQKPIIYSYDVTNALRHLISCRLAQMVDPMGISGYVSAASTDAYRQDALSKLTTALNRANQAREAEDEGKTRTAFEHWNKVFNGRFPSYG